MPDESKFEQAVRAARGQPPMVDASWEDHSPAYDTHRNPYMGQIIAECDCANPDLCGSLGRCVAEDRATSSPSNKLLGAIPWLLTGCVIGLIIFAGVGAFG